MKKINKVNTMYGEFKTTHILKKYQTRKPWTPKDEKKIMSFIPGTITDINVSIGDIIQKGDALYGFKAMKMNNTVKSEIDGVIKSINYKIDESFPKSVVIIEFK